MGSPLAPVLANIFMGHHENNWLNNYAGSGPIIYKRFVDDIFCLFNDQNDAQDFLTYLNKQHPNIKFTNDPEKNGSLPFLDVNIRKGEDGYFETSIYHKPSFTGLLTNFLSYVPSSYKLALIKTLIHRVFKICSSWALFHIHISNLKHTLQRNKFPPKLIDKEINKYLNKIHETCDDKIKKDTNYYKLPYIGDMSKFAQSKIKELSTMYCKTIDINLSFNTCKVGSFLSTKSKSPANLQSSVVYHYNCTSCGASYVGQTTRHCSERIKEHLTSDKKSHIYKHLNNNNNCKQASNESSFKIIDKANSEYTLKIKEAIHIHWLKPTLNKQQYHIKLTLHI